MMIDTINGLFRSRRQKKGLFLGIFFSAPLFDIHMQLFLAYTSIVIT